MDSLTSSAIVPLQATRERIAEISSHLELARIKKKELECHIKAVENFAQQPTGPMELDRFDAYNASIPVVSLNYRTTLCSGLGILQTYISELLKERDFHVQELQRNAYHSSVAHKLPFDVLGQVFTYVVDDTDIVSFVSLTLTAVSVSWREAALHTPAVWTKVRITILSRDRDREPGDLGVTRIDNARRWIERSGVTTLHMRITWGCKSKIDTAENTDDDDDQLLDSPANTSASISMSPRLSIRDDWVDLVASVAHRLGTFDLQCVELHDYDYGCIIPHRQLDRMLHCPIPKLTVFRLDGEVSESHSHRAATSDLPCAISLRGLGCLRVVDLGAKSGCDFQPKEVEGLTSLRSLTINTTHYQWSITEFVEIWMPQSTMLSLCCLSIQTAPDCIMDWPTEVIELPGLERLDLFTIDICDEFFKTFKMPSLAALHVKNITGYPPRGRSLFDGLLERNERFPRLREFELRNHWQRGVDDGLKKFLRAHPDLAALCLIKVSCDKTISALARFPKQPRYAICPRLNRLEVTHPVPDRYNKNTNAVVPSDVLPELIIQSRYTDGVPLDDFSPTKKAFVRLSSLKWNGEEQLPPS